MRTSKQRSEATKQPGQCRNFNLDGRIKFSRLRCEGRIEFNIPFHVTIKCQIDYAVKSICRQVHPDSYRVDERWHLHESEMRYRALDQKPLGNSRCGIAQSLGTPTTFPRKV